jgi:chromosome segregation ATPase
VHACERIQAGSAGWEILQGFEATYECGADLFAWTISAHEEKLRELRRDVKIWEADSRQARGLLELEKKNSARIEALEHDISQKEVFAEDLQARLGEANARIESLEALLDASGRRIAELERAHTAAEAARELLNSQKVVIEDELNELRANTIRRRWLLKKLFSRHMSWVSERA